MHEILLISIYTFLNILVFVITDKIQDRIIDKKAREQAMLNVFGTTDIDQIFKFPNKK